MVAAASARPFTPRLPEGWSAPEIFADTIAVDGLSLRRAGIAATSPNGQEVTGSAAEPALCPTERAAYELLERAATIEALSGPREADGEARSDAGPAVRAFTLRALDGSRRGLVPSWTVFPTSDAPDRWRPARSNGVAIHRTWTEAARRACAELVERDRVLRAWIGETTPERMAFDPKATVLAPIEGYSWSAVRFPPRTDADRDDLDVVGMFGFPDDPSRPFVFGYGTGASIDAALEGAIREATQILAFLWGEAVPAEAPSLAPHAGYHLDHWQVPAHRVLLRAWLADGHTQYARHARDAYGNVALPSLRVDDVTFVDLTPPWLAVESLYVAKAMAATAIPLAFGQAPSMAHLPSELAIHPIA